MVELFCTAFALFGLGVFVRFIYNEYRFLRRRREWREEMKRQFDRAKWEETKQ
jgi:hypothetical protein